MKLLRIAAFVIAGVTAFLMIAGSHPPEFLVADGIVVALLAIGGALPQARLSLPVMLAGFAFALGVFVVAYGAAAFAGEPALPLLAGILGCAAGSLLAGTMVVGALASADINETGAHDPGVSMKPRS